VSLSDLELMKRDVLRLALGTGRMAQPHLRWGNIRKDLRTAMRLTRYAKTEAQYEKAAYYLQQLYRNIIELESFLGAQVDGVTHESASDIEGG